MCLYNLTSCTKEVVDDTVKEENNDCINPELPDDYFPAYPNSWWSYINALGDTVVYEISDSYVECEGKCRPIFLNRNKCIQNNSLVFSFYAGLGTGGAITSPIYTLKKDSTMHCTISFSTSNEMAPYSPGESENWRYKRVTTNIDTALIINNVNYSNVIEVYEYDLLNSNHRYFDYFSKGVGLIKRDSLNVNDTTDHVEILKLNNYFISN